MLFVIISNASLIVGASGDGGKVVARTKEDGPITEITINCPSATDPMKKPSVTIRGKKSGGTDFVPPQIQVIEPISEDKQNDLKDFFKPPNFDKLATMSSGLPGTSGLLAVSAPSGSLLSTTTLDRLALGAGDVADAILSHEPAWYATAGGLAFVGSDPAVDIRLRLDDHDEVQRLVLVLTVKAREGVVPRLRNAFISGHRPESVDESGGLASERPTETAFSKKQRG